MIKKEILSYFADIEAYPQTSSNTFSFHADRLCVVNILKKFPSLGLYRKVYRVTKGEPSRKNTTKNHDK